VDFSCERRDSTTVTPQVFALLNGQQPANAQEAELLNAACQVAFGA
jgi:hypothetical protein